MVQIRANTTKAGADTDSYWQVNTPDTSSDTENNCKSPNDCPDDDNGRDVIPWTKVKVERTGFD